MLDSKLKDMKKIYTLFICFVAIVLAPACKNKIEDFLDKAPGVDVTEDTIFSSRTQVDTFIAGMYLQGMPTMLGLHTQIPGYTSGRFTTSGVTDEVELGASWADQTNWNSGSMTTENIANFDYQYHTRWPAIRRANIILERMDEVPGTDQSYKDQVKGEAKFIRAFNYFEMLKRYGGVPIVDKRLTATDILENPIPRSTFEEVVNFILKDCEDAIAVLPDFYPSNMRGRVTKGAALLLKARLFLLAASPQFNTATPYLDFGANNKLICYGNYDVNRWKKAADAAKAVLDWAPTGNIALITDKGVDKNYKYMWEVHDNPEIILENKMARNRSRSQYPWLGILPAGIYGGYGGSSVTLNFVKLYEKKDGTAQSWNPAGGNDLNQKYAELDYRFAQSVLYNGSYLNPEFPKIETFTGGTHALDCKAGTWQRKFVPDALRQSVTAMPHNYLMRLAEAYLIYAEALNEFSGPSTEIYTAINTIRARSGQPNLPASLGKDDMRTRIRNERAVELAFEDHRLWDIMRWQIAEQDGMMLGSMWGIKVSKIANSTEFRYDPYVFETRIFTKKMYLHPFLKSEVIKGNLTQNPGW